MGAGSCADLSVLAGRSFSDRRWVSLEMPDSDLEQREEGLSDKQNKNSY